MNRLKATIVPLLLALFISACNDKRGHRQHPQTKSDTHASVTAPSTKSDHHAPDETNQSSTPVSSSQGLDANASTASVKISSHTHDANQTDATADASDETNASSPLPIRSPCPKESYYLPKDDGTLITLCGNPRGITVDSRTATTMFITLIDTRYRVTTGMLPHLKTYCRASEIPLIVLDMRTMQPSDCNTTDTTSPWHTDAKRFVRRYIYPYRHEGNVTLPLTLLIIHGHITTAYEGLTPIEMMQSDLKRYHNKER